jgi:peptidoglycan LD-endopeptidase CwlK
MNLDPRSEEKLLGVRPELVKVIREAATRTKFRVTEGLRTPERQKMLVAQRKSKTLNSRHITGHAIDFIAIGDDGIATYDMEDMKRVADVIKECAAEQGVKIEWGGDWKGAWDTPHCELDRKAYPARAVSVGTQIYEHAKNEPVKTGAVAGAGLGAAQVGSDVARSLPSLPPPPDLTSITAWQSAADTVLTSVNWVSTNVTAALLVVGYIGVTVYWTTVWPPVKAFLGKWRAA